MRDSLGWAYLTVAQTGEPIIIQRYNAQDVVLVPRWEWEFLKDMEAAIRAGACPWADSGEPGQPMLDVPSRLKKHQDRALLERCDQLVVLMLDGWRESVGVQAEILIASELGIPTRYWEPNGELGVTLGRVAEEVEP